MGSKSRRCWQRNLRLFRKESLPARKRPRVSPPMPFGRATAPRETKHPPDDRGALAQKIAILASYVPPAPGTTYFLGTPVQGARLVNVKVLGHTGRTERWPS